MSLQIQQHKKQLQATWKVYFTEKVPKDASFVNTLQHAATFNTLEQFAYIYSRLTRPSQLPAGTSLYFVRDSQKMPVWEHHINGGTYQLRRYIDKSADVQYADRTWERVLFACIGEEIQEPMISCLQVTTKTDQCQVSVWHFDSITKRQFSRCQLKLGDIFECKVNDIDYITNMDAIKEKDAMRKSDEQRRQVKAQHKEAKPEQKAALQLTAKAEDKPKAEEKPKTEEKPKAEEKPFQFQVIVDKPRKTNNRKPNQGKK